VDNGSTAANVFEETGYLRNTLPMLRSTELLYRAVEWRLIIGKQQV
jgi:hypothetical protein